MTASTSDSDSDCKFNVLADTSEDVDFSVNLRLPKFSHDCTDVDFISALEPTISKDEIKYLGKLRYSNEWQVTLKSQESRDQLLELGSFIIKRKKCIIYPCGRQAVGRIHWLPIDVPEDAIKDILQHFGEISKFGCEKLFPNTESPHSLIRFFILNLSKNCSQEDIPHFISVNKHQGLVIVKGRDPMCLECRQVGHRKKNCPVMQKKRADRANKNSKKSSKKSKSNTEAEPKSASVADASEQSNTSSKKTSVAKHSSQTATSSSETSDNTRILHDSKENIHAVASDVKRLQHLMNVFRQRMDEVLAHSSLTNNGTAEQSTVQPAESHAEAGASDTSNKQGKRKKKKKSKTSDNFDVSTSEVVSNNTSSKSSLDSGIVSNENSTSNSDNTDNNGNEFSKEILPPNVNLPEISNCAHVDSVNMQNKKKKKKKKSGGSSIPGLTHP